MKQTVVELLIEQLKEHIRKSAHNELGTIRTSDYRIGLSKAIDFCEQSKEMEKHQKYEFAAGFTEWRLTTFLKKVDEYSMKELLEIYEKEIR